jgi:hypothetical protein
MDLPLILPTSPFFLPCYLDIDNDSGNANNDAPSSSSKDK